MKKLKNSNFTTQVVKIIKKDFEVLVDHLLDYETKKWLYLLTRPLMWVLTGWVLFKKRILGIKPKINTLWFDGLSIPCRRVKENAGSWCALDLIYNFKFGGNDLRGKVSDYWFRILTAQAVRNRLKLVKQKLIEAIEDLQTKKRNIRILSIASGSAQAIIEVMEKFKFDLELQLQVDLLDLDLTAIDFTQKLAKKHGIENGITFICGNLYRYLKLKNDTKRPDIIEMVGFLDYLSSDDKARHLLERINKILPLGGIFITANICPNGEREFLTHVVEWPMIYRTPKKLGCILVESGFECEIVCEPLKIFAIGVCKKLLNS